MSTNQSRTDELVVLEVLDRPDRGMSSGQTNHEEHKHHEHHKHGDHDKPEPKLVEVTIDGHKREIPGGHYVVSKLKAVLGVPADYELDKVVGREFKELPDGDTVEVVKGEVFVSHVRRGGSA